jgi:hypothetical protein
LAEYGNSRRAGPTLAQNVLQVTFGTFLNLSFSAVVPVVEGCEGLDSYEREQER